MSTIAIVCSEFNKDIVENLLKIAKLELAELAPQSKIEVYWVSGAGEIPLTIKWLADQNKHQGFLALGAIIRGETTHYDSLCRILERALWDLQKSLSLAIVFSVLMLENKDQSHKRITSRPKEGVKALLRLIELKKEIQS